MSFSTAKVKNDLSKLVSQILTMSASKGEEIF
jgi:hypothetical protein